MTYPPLAVHRGAPSAPGPRTRRILIGLAAAAFVALIAVPWLASFATDWLWFREIRFESVFLASLAARGLLFVGVGAFTFAFLYVNLSLARPRVTDVLTSFVHREGGGGMSVDLMSLVPSWVSWRRRSG
jgi:uncharacterized membrane protein (UPF0182 family)